MKLQDVDANPASFSYKDLIGQDRWNAWTPTRAIWTDVGTPTVTARFRVVGRQAFFQIQVAPATSVATTAGTSYVSLPVASAGLAGEGSMVNLTTLVAVGVCVISASNSRVYVPTQAATGNTLLIAGSYEV